MTKIKSFFIGIFLFCLGIFARQKPQQPEIRKRASKSKYIGVRQATTSGKWLAHIYLNGKANHLGTFDTELEAAEAYQKAKQGREVPVRKSSALPRGISWDRFRNKYLAQITVDGKKFNLGRYLTIEEAIQARTAAVEAKLQGKELVSVPDEETPAAPAPQAAPEIPEPIPEPVSVPAPVEQPARKPRTPEIPPQLTRFNWFFRLNIKGKQELASRVLEDGCDTTISLTEMSEMRRSEVQALVPLSETGEKI